MFSPINLKFLLIVQLCDMYSYKVEVNILGFKGTVSIEM